MATLHVVEGEKCADALAELELVSTTSQGGSNAPEKTDWGPAARFEQVILWKDVDATNEKSGVNPGEKYVNTVAELINGEAKVQGTAPAIVIVDLRPVGLQDGEDIYEWIQTQRMEGKDDAAIRSGLEALWTEYGRRWLPRVEIAYPNQPKPFTNGRGQGSGAGGQKGNGADDGRASLTNFRWEKKLNDKGEEKNVRVALPIGRIRSNVKDLTGGWPCRVRSPGAKTPLLFVDESRTEPRWFGGSETFEAWLQELGALKFDPKQDCEGTNFVKTGNLYHSFGGNGDVSEYEAVEARPHEPAFDVHYYMWRPPAGYNANGEKLAGLLKFFSNVKSPKDLALIAAAFLTPGWGGPYGMRPAFVVTAPDRGCGKSTLAKTIGRVWAGSISVDLNQRGEEQLKERFLSPDALLKRVCLIDNVKGTLSNAMVEALITDEWINGKRLYMGDARRPNTMTWFVTANGVRLSRDMAQRSFFIELTRPDYGGEWDKALNQYVLMNQDFIVADCIAILRAGQAVAVKAGAAIAREKLSDRWSLWAETVLNAACEHPALAAVVGGVKASEVLKSNSAMRDDCDEDKEEAEMLLRGLMERIGGPSGEGYGAANLVFFVTNEPLPLTGHEHFRQANGWLITKDAWESFFVPSDEMLRHWNAIMGKKLNAKQILHIIREHREAGRIVGLDETHRRTGNGYEVAKELLQQHVDSVRAQYRQQKGEDAGAS